MQFLILIDWSEFHKNEYMIQEEIFEVDKKIKQIEGILEKRKEKANEWSTNYKKILQDRPDKTAYLFKQCPSKLMLTTANQS